MPTFPNFDGFVAAMAVGAAGKSDKHHRALCYFSTRFGASDYVCWAAVQQYKIKQSKRRAIFIYDTWVKDAGKADGAGGATLSILDKVNPGGAGDGANPEATLADPITKMKSVKSWTGKLSNWEHRAAYGATPKTLFADLESKLKISMGDMLRMPGFDPNSAVQMHGSIKTSVIAGREALKTATFDPDALGVW